MGTDEAKVFLENRIKQIEQELESRAAHLQQDYPAGKPPPHGAESEIFRYQMERELVQKLLSRETDVPLEERLLKRIQEKEQDKIEYVKRSLARRGYSQRFWSDQVYIEILDQLLSDWLEVREEAET